MLLFCAHFSVVSRLAHCPSFLPSPAKHSSFHFRFASCSMQARCTALAACVQRLQPNMMRSRWSFTFARFLLPVIVLFVSACCSLPVASSQPSLDRLGGAAHKLHLDRRMRLASGCAREATRGSAGHAGTVERGDALAHVDCLSTCVCDRQLSSVRSTALLLSNLRLVPRCFSQRLTVAAMSSSPAPKRTASQRNDAEEIAAAASASASPAPVASAAAAATMGNRNNSSVAGENMDVSAQQALAGADDGADKAAPEPSPKRARRASAKSIAAAAAAAAAEKEEEAAVTQEPVEGGDESAAAAASAPAPKGRKRAAPKTKVARSKSQPAAAAAAGDAGAEEGADDEDVPVKKKGRAASTGAAAAASKKKKKADDSAAASTSRSQSQSSMGGGEGEEGEEGAGAGGADSNVTAVAHATALLKVEAEKRAARPAGSSTIMCWNVNGLRAALKNGAAVSFKEQSRGRCGQGVCQALTSFLLLC